VNSQGKIKETFSSSDCPIFLLPNSRLRRYIYGRFPFDQKFPNFLGPFPGNFRTIHACFENFQTFWSNGKRPYYSLYSLAESNRGEYVCKRTPRIYNPMPSRLLLLFLYPSTINGAFLFKKHKRQTCILKVKRKVVLYNFCEGGNAFH